MPVDLNKLKEELANRPQERSDFEFADFNKLQIQWGTSKATQARKLIKIFSWPPQGGAVGLRVRMHFGLGASGRGSCVCPKQHDPEAECPVCEIASEIAQSGTEIQRKAAIKFSLKERYYILCLDIDELKATGGNDRKIYIWNAAPSCYFDIITEMQAEWGDFTALESSHVLAITSYKEGGRNAAGKIKVSGSPQKMSVVLDQWLHLFPDLNKVIASPPPAMIAAMFGKSPDAQGFPKPTPRVGGRAAGAPEQQAAPQQPAAQSAPANAGFSLSEEADEAGGGVDEIPMTFDKPAQQVAITPTATAAPASTATTPAPAAAKPKKSLDEILGKKSA